jgi:Ca2+-binding EF-hand superfamily protein
MLSFSDDNSERTTIDKSTIDKLFCIFDDNCIGSIDFKEILVAIEISRQTKIRNLVKCLLSIADIRGNGLCTEPILSHVFTAISFNPEEKVRVRNLSNL